MSNECERFHGLRLAQLCRSVVRQRVAGPPGAKTPAAASGTSFTRVCDIDLAAERLQLRDERLLGKCDFGEKSIACALCFTESSKMASDSEDDELEYMLGFVEEPEKPHKLLAHHFPSKVGGQPVRACAYPQRARTSPSTWQR